MSAEYDSTKLGKGQYVVSTRKPVAREPGKGPFIVDGLMMSEDSTHPWGIDISAHWAEISPKRIGYDVRHVSGGGMVSTIGSWWCPTKRWAEWKGRRLCREYDRIMDKSKNWRVT